MDWFERLVGFRETSYADTKAKLEVRDGRLRSRENGADFGIGRLELPSLGQLRHRAAQAKAPTGRIAVRNICGDARTFHIFREHEGAVIQVASQFNMLEMVSPSVTPAAGVTRYEHDFTQGPACAIAAGAATIFRNYFAPIGDQEGQTADRQLDGLADLGEALSGLCGRPVEALWEMTNGYALATREGLEAVGAILRDSNPENIDALRATLRVGVHGDVEVTDEGAWGQTVTQAFCSALPLGYSPHAAGLWEPFARLVLEAAYEATLWTAVLNAARGRSNVLLLTRLGGGAFGNPGLWIDEAMARALDLAAGFALDVRIVSFDEPPESMVRLARRYAA